MKRKLFSLLLAGCMLVLAGCGGSAKTEGTGTVSAGDTAASSKDDRITKYDCVCFGSYPQSEIISEEMKQNYAENVLSPVCIDDSTYISDDPLYRKLTEASDDQWDNNGDIVIEGEKYRRIKKSDAAFSVNDFSENHYNYADESAYHYFIWQPIKWRIMESDDYQMILMADRAIDAFNNQTWDSEVTMWEDSPIRNWLNRVFYRDAFSKNEKFHIVDIEYEDSFEEKPSGAAVYLQRTASPNKQGNPQLMCLSTTYAKAMGVYTSVASEQTSGRNKYNKHCWWLAITDTEKPKVCGVDGAGFVHSKMNAEVKDVMGYGIRPRIVINKDKMRDSFSTGIYPQAVVNDKMVFGHLDWKLMKEDDEAWVFVSDKILNFMYVFRQLPYQKDISEINAEDFVEFVGIKRYGEHVSIMRMENYRTFALKAFEGYKDSEDFQADKEAGEKDFRAVLTIPKKDMEACWPDAGSVGVKEKLQNGNVTDSVEIVDDPE